MKILYIIDSHPQNGGAPISACSIATEISKSCDSVALILPTQEKAYSLSSRIIKVETKGLKNTFPLFIYHPFLALRLSRELKKEINLIKPDLIHVHMPRAAWGIGLLKIFNCLPQKTKLLYTDRDQVKTYRWPLKIVSDFLIEKQFNKIICLTQISTNQWNNPKVVTIPNSAGRQYETYNYAMHKKMREQFNIDRNFTTVMFSGRMSPDKNWNLAKEILISLKEEKVFFIFAISTMDNEQEKMFNEFREDISKENVRHIFFNNVSPTDMADYYYLSDIFILTSNKESFGRTAIEAMSRKSVVIGRNVGGLPEVIGKNKNVIDLNVKEFYKRTKYYIENPKVLNKDKEWFYNRFINEYSLDSNTEKHKLLYEKVLNS